MQNMNAAPLNFSTARVDLLPARADLASRVVEFYERNAQHLAPWGPPVPDDFHTEAFQRNRLLKAEDEATRGIGARWWLCLSDSPLRLIGSISLSPIERGPFQNAVLGYSLDGRLQGQGLMHEALLAVIDHAFSSALGLHRIQAAVRPENLRSLRLLERLGFEREGLAPAYLFIDGAWRDHLMLAIRNPEFSGLPL